MNFLGLWLTKVEVKKQPHHFLLPLKATNARLKASCDHLAVVVPEPCTVGLLQAMVYAFSSLQVPAIYFLPLALPSFFLALFSFCWRRRVKPH